MRYHVLVGTHHKTGTVWMSSVFREISERLVAPYLDLRATGVPWRDSEARLETLRVFISNANCRVIVFDSHSHFPNLAAVDVNYKMHFRGIHMIRDPRDVAISAASYHARATEPWLHIPQAKFGGLTYQQKNKSFSTLKEKILFELRNSNRRAVGAMVNFDSQEVFRDIKYEDLIEDTQMTAWLKVLDYLGFEEAEMVSVLQSVWAKSLFGGKKSHRSAHITSGAKEQWRHVFDAGLSEEYASRFGPKLAKLGYPITREENLGMSKLLEQADTAGLNRSKWLNARDAVLLAQKKFEEDEAAYARFVQRLRDVMATALPAEAIVLVVSKGDNELVEVGSRRAWHFPQTEDGLYCDGNPADGADAIVHLEALRKKGGDFLLFPSTAFWWLDYYSDFRCHLDSRYARIADNEDCIVYDLQSSEKNKIVISTPARDKSDFPHCLNKIDLAVRYKELFKRNDLGVVFEQVIQRIYEKILRPGMDAIDGGAHVGGHTMPMAKLVAPNGHVFAYEPISELAGRTQERVKQARLDAVVSVRELALANYEGEAPFILAVNRLGRMGMSGLRERNYPNRAEMTLTERKVKVTTLDRSLPLSASISFIKLDLEGGELHALQGAKRILTRDRPVVVFENGRQGAADKYGYDSGMFFDFFADLSYGLTDLFGSEFRPDLWTGIDLPWYFIALPKERPSEDVRVIADTVNQMFSELIPSL